MKKFEKEDKKTAMMSLWTCLFVGWFPIVFLYAQNVAEVSALETVALLASA